MAGRLDISTEGQRHEITFAVDRIRQSPEITRAVTPDENIKNGTSIKLYWPDLACSTLTDSKASFLQIASDYTFVNPHLTLTVEWFGERTVTEATDPTWSKYRPSDPTSAHWYTAESFERLVSAYIAHDQDHGRDRLIREVVKEFRGLSGSAKQKVVLESTGLARTNLSALAVNGGLDHKVIAKLLKAMQEHSTAVKPAALGVIGKAHIEKRFAEMGGEMESFQYKRTLATDSDGLPNVIETAFVWLGDGNTKRRRIITGVNWSPGIVNPFRSLGAAYDDGLSALLEKRFAGESEPIIFLLHCACPRVQYTDRGKSAVAIR